MKSVKKNEMKLRDAAQMWGVLCLLLDELRR